MKSFFSFLIGILVGIALLVGSVGLVGYLVLSSYTVGDVADVLGVDKEKTGLTDDELAYEIINSIFPLLNSFSDIMNMTVEQFESTIGTRALSSFLVATFGADATTLRSGKLSNIMENTLKSLSLGPIVNALRIELPKDIPLFSDPDFLNKPLVGQFSSFNDIRIDQLVEIVYDDDATDENKASDKILQKLGKLTIEELKGDSIMETIGDMELGDIIDESENEDSILNNLRGYKISELSTAIDNMPITDVFTINENSNMVLQNLKNGKYDGGEDGKPVTISQIDKALPSAIENCVIGDFLGEQTSNEERILTSLRGTQLNSTDMNNKIKSLTLADMFENYDVGFLGLVPPETTLNGLSGAIQKPITETSMYRLEKVGIYEFDLENKNERVKSVFYNSTTQGVLKTYLNIITDPGSILNSTTGTSFEISESISNFTDWMNNLDDKPGDGDTLILTEDISFSNDSDEPFIITVA
ncbi:MAG: hypothetical protein LBF68_01445, partial [Christensenellaceae bacterium]|nr:hypothetical protein [Christensenellaceae bacterium]